MPIHVPGGRALRFFLFWHLSKDTDQTRGAWKIMHAHLSAEQLPYLGIRYQIKYHKCNLDCPYCIADWKNQPMGFDTESFRQVLTRIKGLPYRVSLRIGLGGELFTSDALMQEVSNICNEENNIIGVSFSTNLVASWRRIERFLESTNTAKLGIGCTLHDTVIRDVELFFDKIKRLKEKGVMLYVGYVATPQRISFIREYKRRCDELNVPLIMNSLLGPGKGANGADQPLVYPRDYTEEEKAELKGVWDTPHSYNLLVESCSTRGMPCSAGKNYIFIDHKGSVSPCGSLRDKRVMGNILKEDITFQQKDTLCPVKTCWCGNENQALRIVDKYYDRTHALRMYSPKKVFSKEELYEGYNTSIYKNYKKPDASSRNSGLMTWLKNVMSIIPDSAVGK